MPEFTLQAIINGDSLQLSETFASIAAADSIAPAELRQQLAIQFFTDFSRANLWDAQLAQHLQNLRTTVLNQLANDDEFYCTEQHPLREFFTAINEPASRWCVRDSKSNQQLFDKLSALLQLAAQCSPTDDDQHTDYSKLTQAVADFKHWLASETKRADMLETRLCET